MPARARAAAETAAVPAAVGAHHKTNTCTTQAFARYQHTKGISIHQIVNTRGGSWNLVMEFVLFLMLDSF